MGFEVILCDVFHSDCVTSFTVTQFIASVCDVWMCVTHFIASVSEAFHSECV